MRSDPLSVTLLLLLHPSQVPGPSLTVSQEEDDVLCGARVGCPLHGLLHVVQAQAEPVLATCLRVVEDNNRPFSPQTRLSFDRRKIRSEGERLRKVREVRRR